MGESFITLDMMMVYTTYVMIVYLVVKFTKELPFIKSMPTKYYVWIVSFIGLIAVNLLNSTFKLQDVFLYAISSILIAMNGNGISDFNKSDRKTKTTNKIEGGA